MRGESKFEEISQEKERLTKYEDKALNHNEQTNDQDLTDGIPTFPPFERRPFKQTNKQRVKVSEISNKKKHLTMNEDKKDKVWIQSEQTNDEDLTKNNNKNILEMKMKDVIPKSSLKKILNNADKFKIFIRLLLRREKPKHTNIRLY